MKLLLRVLVLSSVVYVAYGLCNACSAITGAACVANNQFKICVNGLPSGAAFTCPDGTVCSESGNLCVPTGSAPAACGACGECNGTNTFACTGYNTFALCYGTTAPSSQNFTCTGSLVCNVDSAMVCIDPLTTGIGGTCPSVPNTSSSTSTTTTTTTTTAAPTTTTPNPALSPTTYCAVRAQSGRFDVTSDSTCKTYVYCYLYNSVWTGALFECQGQTRFNASTGLCQVGTPTRCAN